MTQRKETPSATRQAVINMRENGMRGTEIAMNDMTETKFRKQWQKILYRQQPYPDNYSGGEKQFLKELRKNVSAVHYDYKSAVFGGILLMTHLDIVVLYFVLFFYSINSPDPISSLSPVLILFMFIALFYGLILSEDDLITMNNMRTLASLLLFGYSFTPIIRTLTTTISTDTIYAVSIISATFSCIFHDYGVKAPVVSYPISMSSGLCSGIFLLSRFNDNTPAFVLLVIGFALHAYGADFRNKMFSRFPACSIVTSILISLCTFYFITEYSLHLMIFWVVFHLFVIFFCPYVLIRKQSGKCTIHGPWDEAIPMQTDN